MTDTMDHTSSKPPQISEMFQKFALAFKTKTFELFADDDNDDYSLSAANSAADGFQLLDSSEDFIPDQKVIILKPDKPLDQETTVAKPSSEKTQIRPLNTELAQSLVSSVFATISSFEASYLQLQTSHVPFDEEGIRVADEAIVSHLKRMSDLKRFYNDFCRSFDFAATDLPISSCLEAQVQENQSKLRVLGTVSDRLQEDIDQRDNEVMALRRKLNDIQMSNAKLGKRLSCNVNNLSLNCEVLLCVKVFDSVLNDACRATHRFTKILISLMKKAGWDLDLAANSVQSGVDYVKKGHNRYAFLSYVCLGMFHGFDLPWFGLDESKDEIQCNGHAEKSFKINVSLKKLLEHVSSSPMELLSRNNSCDFSRFCEKKYQELIHPTMESSIFRNLDKNMVVLNSWRSLSVFYESFVNMASSVWTLHKLAFSFDPVVEIFQVEKGVDFSMVYMEDVTRKFTFPMKTRLKVGFTVVPGFKIGRTVIQSQVYLNAIRCTE